MNLVFWVTFFLLLFLLFLFFPAVTYGLSRPHQTKDEAAGRRGGGGGRRQRGPASRASVKAPVSFAPASLRHALPHGAEGRVSRRSVSVMTVDRPPSGWVGEGRFFCDPFSPREGAATNDVGRVGLVCVCVCVCVRPAWLSQGCSIMRPAGFCSPGRWPGIMVVRRYPAFGLAWVSPFSGGQAFVERRPSQPFFGGSWDWRFQTFQWSFCCSV